MSNRSPLSGPNSGTPSATKSTPKGKKRSPEEAVHSSKAHSRSFGSSPPQRPFSSPHKAFASPHKANSAASISEIPRTPSKSISQPRRFESPPSLSPDTITVARRRPRAQTADLQVPQPESHLTMYTDERVGKSIDYVNQQLGSKLKKPSPIQEKALLVYKGACQDYLDAREENLPERRKKEMLSEIRQYEKEISDSGWVKAEGSKDYHKLQSQLLYLRRLHYYARYGDYAGRLSHRVRQGAIVHKVKGWDMLSGAQQWTKISEQIKQESSAWNNCAVTKDREAHPTTSVVMEACMAIGTEFSNMIRAIHTYAARNHNLHNPINNLVAEGNFPEIANTICDDLAELGNIMPIEMCDKEQFMWAVLLELRDVWFKIRDEGDFETKPFSWIPKLALIAEWEATLNSAGKKVASQAIQAQAITHGAKQRLDALNNEEHLIRQFSIGPTSNTLPAPGSINKRKASGPLSLTPSARKKAWKSIQETRKKAIHTFKSSLALQKECSRVVSQYKDSFGTSSPPSRLLPRKSLRNERANGEHVQKPKIALVQCKQQLHRSTIINS